MQRHRWVSSRSEQGRVTYDIAAFLDQGGSLFMSGQQIAEHFGGLGYDREWLARYLGAAFVSCCATRQVGAADGDRGDILTFGLSGGDCADNSYSPDELRAVGDAMAVFRYLPEDGGTEPARPVEKPRVEPATDTDGGFDVEAYERDLFEARPTGPQDPTSGRGDRRRKAQEGPVQGRDVPRDVLGQPDL